MLENKLLIRFFSSGLQSVGVQVLGSLFFYLISVYLTKDNFGMISWMNAVSLFITTLLGLGLEQVVTRRIAASNRSDWAAGAFLIHSITGFSLTFLVLLVLKFATGNKVSIYQYLPWFFAAQGLIYVGVPLKQYLNAKEKFTPYGIIAIISNSAKIVAVICLQQAGLLNIHTVVIVLVSTAGFELGCSLAYIITKTTFSFKFHLKAYVKLLKESSAQYISVIFDMSLSRMDWILLGMMTTNVVLADYSFAYRAFELARLPMLIIAPLLLPRLSRLMANNTKPIAEYQQQINSFTVVEMCLAMLIPLVLNILWGPVVSLITNGKYGESNALQFLILSLCIPLQLFINLLWSLSFGAKKYKQVTTITICCAVVNVGLNLILISKFNGLGAAVAFITTTVLQCSLYYRLVYRHIMVISLRPVMLFLITAVVLYFVIFHLHLPFLFQLLIAVTAYISIAILTRQINKQHIYYAKQLLS